MIQNRFNKVHNNQLDRDKMCEFEPFNPLAIYQQSLPEEPLCDSLSFSNTQESASMEIEDATQIEESSHQSEATSSKCSSNSSKFHNMTKQLVITMKQIMSKTMKDFGSNSNIRKIIKQIWERLIKKTHPTKKTLKAMFDLQVNSKILKKEGLIDSEDQFEAEDFQEAMQELKGQLVLRLRESNVRSNLIDRKIANKELLSAYIQHFLHEELQGGDIKARFGPSGAIKINSMISKSKQDEDFISDLLV